MSVILSRPARGEWIEITIVAALCEGYKSRPARGEWIEICIQQRDLPRRLWRPARGQWNAS